MKEKNLNATMLCKVTGIGKSSISQYLSGKNEPTEKRKEIIAKALNLPANYFKVTQINTEYVETPKLSVTKVAKLMGKSKKYVYKGLQNKTFSWGYGVNMGKKWSYHISTIKFFEYMGYSIEEVKK